MMRRWLTVLFLSCYLGSSAIAICRPTGIDLTVRLPGGNEEKYFPMSGDPEWATQNERECLEQARFEAVNELGYLFGSLCTGAEEDGDDLKTLAMSRLLARSPYRGALYAPKGAQWFHASPAGRLYQFPRTVLQAYRSCFRSARNRPLVDLILNTITPSLAPILTNRSNTLDLLDLDDNLIDQAPWELPEGPRYDPEKRSSSFPVDTRIKFPPCGGGNGCVDLHTTHLAHQCSTLKKVGLPLPDFCDGVPSVRDAQATYERGCGDDQDCGWFRRMPFFSGYTDPEWSTDEAHQIALGEDVTHGACWMPAQAAGSAPRSEQCAQQHSYWHKLENDALGWLGVYSWDDVSPGYYLSYQDNKPLSPKDILPLLIAEYGLD